MLHVAVVSMMGQYNHLIARRVLQLGHRATMVFDSSWLHEFGDYDAVIIGGGPARAPLLPQDFLERFRNFLNEYEGPVLGICLGHQAIARALGGEVVEAEKPEYGPMVVEVISEDPLFLGFPRRFKAWMSHNDEVRRLPPGFRHLAKSTMCRIQAMGSEDNRVYGVQFHPEVEHTQYGLQLFRNFLSMARR